MQTQYQPNIIGYFMVGKPGYSHFLASFYPSNIRPYIPPYNFDIFEMISVSNNRLRHIKLSRMEQYLNVSLPKFLIVDFESVHDECCANNTGKFTKEKYLKSVIKVAGDVKYFYDKCCNEDDIIIISSDHGVRVVDEPASQRHGCTPHITLQTRENDG